MSERMRDFGWNPEHTWGERIDLQGADFDRTMTNLGDLLSAREEVRKENHNAFVQTATTVCAIAAVGAVALVAAGAMSHHVVNFREGRKQKKAIEELKQSLQARLVQEAATEALDDFMTARMKTLIEKLLEELSGFEYRGRIEEAIDFHMQRFNKRWEEDKRGYAIQAVWFKKDQEAYEEKLKKTPPPTHAYWNASEERKKQWVKFTCQPPASLAERAEALFFVEDLKEHQSYAAEELRAFRYKRK